MKHLRSILTCPGSRFALLLGLVAVLALGLSACQLGGKATVTLHVTNGGTQATTLSLAPASLSGPAMLTPEARPPATVQSFTPTSLKVPVVQILLADGSSGATAELYHCDPNTDPNACTIDLAKNLQALQDLINTRSQATAGTYDTIRVMTCTNGQGGSASSNPIDYTAEVTGRAVIGGATYVTDPNAPGGATLDTSGSATPKAIKVGFSGCGRDYPLPTPITLKDGDTFTLSLYIDLADIAWIEASGSTTPQTWLPSGCVRDANATTPTAPTGPFVCLNYADVAAAPGEVPPTLERYLVLDGATDPTTLVEVPTGGLFGIYYDANGNALSGYTRFYFNQTFRSLGFMPATPFRRLSANSDGTTLNVATYGSSATGSGYFEAAQFPIDGGYSDTYTSSDGDPSICAVGQSCPYTAKLLP